MGRSTTSLQIYKEEKSIDAFSVLCFDSLSKYIDFNFYLQKITLVNTGKHIYLYFICLIASMCYMCTGCCKNACVFACCVCIFVSLDLAWFSLWRLPKRCRPLIVTLQRVKRIFSLNKERQNIYIYILFFLIFSYSYL